jgi:N-acetyltransferase 10
VRRVRRLLPRPAAPVRMGVRKKVDERLRTLLGNCVKAQHRSLVVIVGDNGKDQVVNLHYMLSKLQVRARPSVLWCYKKELGFSTYKKKRMRAIKKMVQRGLYDAERDDPFELFISSTNIRWAFYNETDKILGQTFGMVVLQDFEALTPNLLARTVETVEGGGCVVVLLKKLDSLRQLYTMTMDAHARFRTEAHANVKPRFNERWLLSLASCETCAVVDDELNILPLSKHIRDIEPLEAAEEGSGAVEDWNTAKASQLKLAQLKQSLSGTQPAAALVGLAKTTDQATAVLAFLDVVADKSLASTVTLTAGRGRGKSAALGIAIASAVAFGYSNIFVTSPSPENLKTVFEFLLKAFDALEYKEHLDYEVVQSTNPEFNKAVVRVSVFHQHRQTIQYIDPADHAALAQAELVVIDEAAAIPLPLVRKLIGPYLVFLSSTVHGYEGTGRSLSLKLISQLRQSADRSAKGATEGGWRTNEHMFKNNLRDKMELAADKGKGASAAALAAGNVKAASGGGAGARQLREIVLSEPIRYAGGDPVEAWLNRTLCLDATDAKQQLTRGTPPPAATELFAVDRDVLLSHHSVSEAMMQRIVALFVASHYKNSPNDLLLLSDAPAHRLFVLMGPQPEDAQGLPDILCAVQVALEGGISRRMVQDQLRSGNRASGDLVPWTVAQQFQDDDFPHLDGARVVRIATHAAATRMGYGKRALELLAKFYQGELVNADGDAEEAEAFENLGSSSHAAEGEPDARGLLGEKVRPRKNLPPLLVPLGDLRPPRLHYLSVSYGLTRDLFNFWAGSGFRPVYLRQTPNELTGEYSCIMLRALDTKGMDDGLHDHWEDGYVGC